LIFIGGSTNTKRTKGIVEDEIGDDPARRQGVPTIVVDLSSGTVEAALQRPPPPPDRSLMVTVAVAPSTGEPAAISALGTGPVPRVLKKKVLSIKKFAL
jgi:hypothetical protein